MEDAGAAYRNVEDNVWITREHSEKRLTRKSSFKQEASFTLPLHDTVCQIRRFSTGSTARPPLSLCETTLAENILAEHQSETVVVGSVGTWNKGNDTAMLMSSTPADALLSDDTKQSFTDDLSRPSPVTGEPSDSGQLIQTKEEHGNESALNQVWLQVSGSCCDLSDSKDETSTESFRIDKVRTVNVFDGFQKDSRYTFV